MNRGVRAALLLPVFLGVAGYWAWTDRQPADDPKSSPAAIVAATPEPRLPGRTYLQPEQLRQAYQSGELDRPVKSLLAINKPLRYGGYRWDDTGVPKGPTWIRVDLNSQILSVFRAGHEIGTAVIMYGAESKQTPSGVYPIIAKAREHRSNLYDADMPFTLRLTNDGISVHGSDVRWGAATHGCIGVPVPFAEKLFDAVAIKDEVVVLHRPGAKAASAPS